MANEQEADASAVSKLVLSGCQDVRVAGELQRQLIEITSKDNVTVVECNEIESMDASTIQLLWAAKRESANRLRLDVSPSSDFARWSQLAGIAESLFATTK